MALNLMCASGVDVSDATAVASNVLAGKTFYAGADEGIKTGTMANKGAVSASVDPGSTYTIPAGYHNGEGKVTANRAYTTQYLGSHGDFGNDFSYDVKSKFPSIYSKITRSNFYAEPFMYMRINGRTNNYNRIVQQCHDLIRYDSSTGVVTMDPFIFEDYQTGSIGVLFKLYMVY